MEVHKSQQESIEVILGLYYQLEQEASTVNRSQRKSTKANKAYQSHESTPSFTNCQVCTSLSLAYLFLWRLAVPRTSPFFHHRTVFFALFYTLINSFSILLFFLLIVFCHTKRGYIESWRTNVVERKRKGDQESRLYILSIFSSVSSPFWDYFDTRPTCKILAICSVNMSQKVFSLLLQVPRCRHHHCSGSITYSGTNQYYLYTPHTISNSRILTPIFFLLLH